MKVPPDSCVGLAGHLVVFDYNSQCHSRDDRSRVNAVRH
jgi:hypothetical protein